MRALIANAVHAQGGTTLRRWSCSSGTRGSCVRRNRRTIRSYWSPSFAARRATASPSPPVICVGVLRISLPLTGESRRAPRLYEHFFRHRHSAVGFPSTGDALSSRVAAVRGCSPCRTAPGRRTRGTRGATSPSRRSSTTGSRGCCPEIRQASGRRICPLLHSTRSSRANWPGGR
jgi:hypothetical protein